ncbi:MAG: crossover junction endodeoxyribonuclease RuvC [Verrucomicrobia bacterium]|nr:crossover junction endodeoxyribonuclease RuvC [Verrucomicrobiota bacterium]
MPKKSVRALWAAKLAGKEVAPAAGTPVSPILRTPFKGRILGIDPSLRGSGFAVVDCLPNRQFQLVYAQTLNLPAAKFTMVDCLGAIARAVEHALLQYRPVHVAVEETIYVQNFRTAQILGMARGSAIATAAKGGFPLFEYPPLRIKQAVAGFGRASKEQVARQIQALMRLESTPAYDEADAAAVALCHAFTWQPESGSA